MRKIEPRYRTPGIWKGWWLAEHTVDLRICYDTIRQKRPSLYNVFDTWHQGFLYFNSTFSPHNHTQKFLACSLESGLRCVFPCFSSSDQINSGTADSHFDFRLREEIRLGWTKNELGLLIVFLSNSTKVFAVLRHGKWLDMTFGSYERTTDTLLTGRKKLRGWLNAFFLLCASFCACLFTKRAWYGGMIWRYEFDRHGCDRYAMDGPRFRWTLSKDR